MKNSQNYSIQNDHTCGLVFVEIKLCRGLNNAARNAAYSAWFIATLIYTILKANSDVTWGMKHLNSLTQLIQSLIQKAKELSQHGMQSSKSPQTFESISKLVEVKPRKISS